VRHVLRPEGATPQRLQDAIALNHIVWMTGEENAEVHSLPGVTWTATGGPKPGGSILFPDLSDADAPQAFDRIVAFYRARGSQDLIGFWSLDPPKPVHTQAYLLARGFQLGWQPHWMSLDLSRFDESFTAPIGVRIESVTTEDWGNDNIPYYSRRTSRRLLTKGEHALQLGAWLDGEPVGNTVVLCTEGDRGVAGIYDCGVAEAARNRGIGKALVVRACQWVRDRGYAFATLNATADGERIYRRVGFESIGFGCTWWLNVPRLSANPPSRAVVAFGQAVGCGNVDALTSLRPSIDNALLDAPLASGMTPLDVAIACGKPESAEWLVSHGATLDIVSAWDLGWKDRVGELLRRSPDLLNRRAGQWGATPLHIAVERDDAELARLVLAAGADTTIQDIAFRSTPMGWARHLGRGDMVRLLEESA